MKLLMVNYSLASIVIGSAADVGSLLNCLSCGLFFSVMDKLFAYKNIFLSDAVVSTVPIYVT